ncbi:hypothetical protein A3Q56_02980 [Intoshia linei]|uniref:Uncharacterized protein n=1 Tax=Intoshia linei TaxID=1819745 RepID=A0A177B5B1_9BILA|nr:hypothetical protein A3Q56_02980 [Intoshia linei]
MEDEKSQIKNIQDIHEKAVDTINRLKKEGFSLDYQDDHFDNKFYQNLLKKLYSIIMQLISEKNDVKIQKNRQYQNLKNEWIKLKEKKMDKQCSCDKPKTNINEETRKMITENEKLKGFLMECRNKIADNDKLLFEYKAKLNQKNDVINALENTSIRMEEDAKMFKRMLEKRNEQFETFINKNQSTEFNIVKSKFSDESVTFLQNQIKHLENQWKDFVVSANSKYSSENSCGKSSNTDNTTVEYNSIIKRLSKMIEKLNNNSKLLTDNKHFYKSQLANFENHNKNLTDENIDLKQKNSNLQKENLEISNNLKQMIKKFGSTKNRMKDYIQSLDLWMNKKYNKKKIDIDKRDKLIYTYKTEMVTIYDKFKHILKKNQLQQNYVKTQNSKLKTQCDDQIKFCRIIHREKTDIMQKLENVEIDNLNKKKHDKVNSKTLESIHKEYMCMNNILMNIIHK